MPMVSVEVMKTIDEKKQQKKNKQRQKEARTGAIVTLPLKWELNDFVMHLRKCS